MVWYSEVGFRVGIESILGLIEGRLRVGIEWALGSLRSPIFGIVGYSHSIVE